tara:strand:- start:229 stop:555 length:327 start_codon:yes stop_codon:yes gene_type:complete
MANKRTGPDYLDQKSKKKKNTQIRAVRKPSSFAEGDKPHLDWKRGGLKRYDPEVLKKYPHSPVETIGVSIMRDKMQDKLDKQKGKTKEKKPSQKMPASMLKKANSKKK